MDAPRLSASERDQQVQEKKRIASPSASNSKMTLVGRSLLLLLIASPLVAASIDSKDDAPTSTASSPPNSNSSPSPAATRRQSAAPSSRQNRLNSRFLRTFPTLNVYGGNSLSAPHNFVDNTNNNYNGNNYNGNNNYNGGNNYNYNSNYNGNNGVFGRREELFGGEGEGERVPLGVPMGMAMSMGMGPPMGNELINGNSPVFYIRLPPAPYILVPGLGYVSPHPYNSPMAMGLPSPVMVKEGLGSSPFSGSSSSSSSSSSSDLSGEQSQKSVISLPLKFLSNGRPSQIESPKKPSKSPDSKGSALISGGKYSFNGKPTAVFVVRSPAPPSATSARARSRALLDPFPHSSQHSKAKSN